MTTLGVLDVNLRLLDDVCANQVAASLAVCSIAVPFQNRRNVGKTSHDVRIHLEMIDVVGLERNLALRSRALDPQQRKRNR